MSDNSEVPVTSTAAASGDQPREGVLRGAQDALVAPALVPDLAGLLARYTRALGTEDLATIGAPLLAAVVDDHLGIGAERPSGTSLVHFANTTVADARGQLSGELLIVTDDKPFIVDSVLVQLGISGIEVQSVVHPTFVVTRDAQGTATAIASPLEAGQPRTEALVLPVPGHEVDIESWVYVRTGIVPDEADREALVTAVRRTLHDVDEVNADWPQMRAQAQRISAELTAHAPYGLEDRAEEASHFLDWLDDNFSFFGYQEYDLVTLDDGTDALQAVAGSGLGLFRRPSDAPTPQPKPLRRKNLEKARERAVLIITKANSRSTVHRDAFLDYIGVKRFDAFGQVNGERRFLGLFTLSIYTQSVQHIPVVNRKVREVLEGSGFRADSHNGRDVLAILENYPRDELFQADAATLRHNVLAIRQLAERRRSWVFVRTDPYERFVTALVYLPRDTYNTKVRVRIADLLRDAYGASYVEHESRVSDSPLARLYFVARVPSGQRLPEVDAVELRRRIVETARSWNDQLTEQLTDARGQFEGITQAASLRGAFPDSYREAFAPADAIADLPHILTVVGEGAEPARTVSAGEQRTPAPSAIAFADRLSLRLYHDVEGGQRIKLFHDQPVTLSEVLPILTNLGVEVINEHPYVIALPARAEGDAPRVAYVYDFGVRAPDTFDVLAGDIAEAFAAAWVGWVESDPLDRLITTTTATWREVGILRAYVRYLRQIGLSFSTRFIADTLVAHPEITLALIELFEVSFDPATGLDLDQRRAAGQQVVDRITQQLTAVTSLDTDTVLRRLTETVVATVRTDAYQFDADGAPKPQLTFKIEPRRIQGVPKPVPLHEIWVYSPEVEGVHLRFGQVARGGLRWSDRREDFRTEILGLVKAQIVKNAVIVPTGAKGGFFPKRLPDPATDRAAWAAAGQHAYELFIRGLLAVTDNRDGSGAVVRPPSVIAYDADDPYLVVAADKGTARFSDVANRIADEFDFWLHDAFASGGSHGFDHKAMGITARGAWTSVERHFRELGVDVATDPFTAVGIGDMSGDVFGNGLLLSHSVRLVAAFDHRDVFLDPAPDAEAAWAERKRLFELPGSSWADYRADLISTGGGVYSRRSKAVPISPEVAEVLGLPTGDQAPTDLTPNELIRAILTAPVDLLYNGGIGTYVCGGEETDAEIGDRANDAIRVTGAQLRARVVGEGGNLGFSQAGRIEAAHHGVRLNVDAIDNSAGVDTSDHEVNLKILLAGPDDAGEVISFEARNQLLAGITDEVAALVLDDNYRQNRLLGLERDVAELVPYFQRQIAQWQHTGVIDRQLEHLPDDAELTRRIEAGQGLTSPELSTVISYAKITLKQQIIDSPIPDEPWTTPLLDAYFPPEITARYGTRLRAHPLAREIIATVLAGDIVDHGGAHFAFSVIEETSVEPAQVVRAWAVVREVFAVDDLYARVRATDNVVAVAAQDEVLVCFKRALGRAVRLIIEQHGADLDVTDARARYVDAVASLRPLLVSAASADDVALRDRLVTAGFDTAVADAASTALEQVHLLGVVDLTEARVEHPTEEQLRHTAELEFAALHRYRIETLLVLVSGLPRRDLWQTLARSSLRQDVYAVLRQITARALEVQGLPDTADADARLDAWEAQHADTIARVDALVDRLADAPAGDPSPLLVALRLLRTVL